MSPLQGPSCASWQIGADANVGWRFWGGEYVVHHQLSNDTFRLSECAGRLLVCLADGEPRTEPLIAAACDVSGGDLQPVLEELLKLGFVFQC